MTDLRQGIRVTVIPASPACCTRCGPLTGSEQVEPETLKRLNMESRSLHFLMFGGFACI